MNICAEGGNHPVFLSAPHPDLFSSMLELKLDPQHVHSETSHFKVYLSSNCFIKQWYNKHVSLLIMNNYMY